MSHVQAYVMTDPAGMSTIKTISISSTVIGWWKRCDWGWKGMHNGVLCTHLKMQKIMPVLQATLAQWVHHKKNK